MNPLHCHLIVSSSVPILSQPTKLLVAIRSDCLVAWLISEQGALHISLRTHKIQSRGRKKRTNKHGLGLAPSAKKKSVTLWHRGFCELTWACTRAKILTKPLAMLTSARVGSPGLCRSTGLSIRLSDFCWLSFLLYFHLLSVSFYRLCPSLDCYLKPTVLFCSLLPTAFFCLLLDLPSLVFSLSWEISSADPLCGFRAKIDKGILWLAPTHTNTTNAQHGVTYIRWLTFSCDLWSLYTPVYFISMWFSDIIIISNSNSASPWNIPLWIFISANIFLPTISFAL